MGFYIFIALVIVFVFIVLKPKTLGFRAVSLKDLGLTGKNIYIEDILPKAFFRCLVETPKNTADTISDTAYSEIEKLYVLEKYDKIPWVMTVTKGEKVFLENAMYPSFEENDIMLFKKISFLKKKEYLKSM